MTATTRAYEKTFDGRFEYVGFYGCASWCRLEIWDAPGQPPVVIVTNPLEDNGTSVTNMAEGLAALVCRRFGLEPRALIWIECYEREDNNKRGNDERVGDERAISHFSPRTKRSEFTRVFFQVSPEDVLTDPQWQPFGLAQAEALVGHLL